MTGVGVIIVPRVVETCVTNSESGAVLLPCAFPGALSEHAIYATYFGMYGHKRVGVFIDGLGVTKHRRDDDGNTNNKNAYYPKIVSRVQLGCRRPAENGIR